MQPTHFTLDLVIGQTSHRVTVTVGPRPDRGLPLFELVTSNEAPLVHSLGEKHISTMIMQFLLANRVEVGATVHVGKITEGTYGNDACVEYADVKSGQPSIRIPPFFQDD